MHYRRWKRTGTTDKSSWGSHHKNPLYESWRWTCRIKEGRVPEWEDFQQFLKDVGIKPEGKYYFQRLNPREPFGPSNFYWKEDMGLSIEEKATNATRQKAWRDRNPAGVKNFDLKKHFGITIQDYEKMSKAQDNKCGICNREESFGRKGVTYRLAVDHCHKTGKIRGLLCNSCNKAIGSLRDDPEIIRKAADYVERGGI
jgi:hypothetical protein